MNILFLIFCFLIFGYHIGNVSILEYWLFPFVLGISYALNREKITSFLNRINLKILFICNLFLLISVAFLRLEEWRFGGAGMDRFFTITLIIFIIITVRKVKKITPAFEYLGKHSMNIFLIHTFIFYYFYSYFIYSFRYSVLIFIVLMSCSLCISILIEYIKKTVGIYRIEKKIIELYLTINNS